MKFSLNAAQCLPEDGLSGTLVGRAWLPGDFAGPSLVVLREVNKTYGAYDISATAPTCAELLEADDPAACARAADGPRIGAVEQLLANSVADDQDPDQPFFLAPTDLQVIKAGGVTFMSSLMERVIEEQARGDVAKAASIRRELSERIGTDLSQVVPGSDTANRLKAVLVEQGQWSQYLEVGIGPDAEVFTKAPVLSAIGVGGEVGIHPRSSWNNPEPEVVLVVNSAGRIVGATLGNDVNLRDFEGRSALLLGKAKDNNASCALGPFIRLFDESYDLDDVRGAELALTVQGDDGFVLEGRSSMREISRDPADLVAQTMGANHQYPDGLALFTGTMFAPVEDRDEPGQGFTHKVGDVVSIASAKLGTLVNRVNHTDKAPPWRFGIGALMRNLAARGLL